MKAIRTLTFTNDPSLEDTRPHRVKPPQFASNHVKPPPKKSGGCSKWISLLGVTFCLLAAIFVLFPIYRENINQYTVLQRQFFQLSSEHQSLQNRFTSLQQKYNYLIEDNNILVDQYNDLVNRYNNLANQYDKLEREAVRPPYILTHDREISMAFRRLDGTVTFWKIPFESLEAIIERGNQTRGKLPTKNFKNGAGQEFTVEDFTPLIDPDPFVRVITDVYQQAPNEDYFIEESWKITTQLSSWKEEIGEIPRFPLETLLAGGGDCEDLSILFASLIIAAPTDWKIDLVYMDINNPSDPQEVNHVIVHVDTGKRDYLIETTSDQAMEPYDHGVSGWYIEVMK